MMTERNAQGFVDATSEELAEIEATMDARRAWEVLRDAIRDRDECPDDWETCPYGKLVDAEARQVKAMRQLQNIGAYLGILK